MLKAKNRNVLSTEGTLEENRILTIPYADVKEKVFRRDSIVVHHVIASGNVPEKIACKTVCTIYPKAGVLACYIGGVYVGFCVDSGLYKYLYETGRCIRGSVVAGAWRYDRYANLVNCGNSFRVGSVWEDVTDRKPLLDLVDIERYYKFHTDNNPIPCMVTKYTKKGNTCRLHSTNGRVLYDGNSITLDTEVRDLGFREDIPMEVMVYLVLTGKVTIRNKSALNGYSMN